MSAPAAATDPPAASGASSSSSSNDYSKQNVPLQCEREPIHIVNRIQPCGTLLVVDSELRVVQCSANAFDLLPADFAWEESGIDSSNDDDGTSQSTSKAKAMGYDPRLDAIIGRDLGLLLQPEAVEQIGSLVSSAGAQESHGESSSGHAHRGSAGSSMDDLRSSVLSHISHQDPLSSLTGALGAAHLGTTGGASGGKTGTAATAGGGGATLGGGKGGAEAARNFLIRSKATGHLSLASKSCSVTQSGEFFLLEIEDLSAEHGSSANSNGTAAGGAADEETTKTEIADLGDRDVMLFMEGIARELRRCWSIEEMASLVCSRIMTETPYDRGMVYRFDPGDDSGEIIYESFRQDARTDCRKDSFLGLRFPASDIPRQARELFMRNTLRYVYDVNGKDWPLYPSRVTGSKVVGGEHYTDLSMCRLRGSSYVHLQYLRNMKVTSTLVIAIIVNKRLWGLYSFHGYREPIAPNARTRFLCEMASIMTSMVMESLTRMEDHRRLMDMEQVMVQLNTKQQSMGTFMDAHHERLMETLGVNVISFRTHHTDGTKKVRSYDVDGHTPVDGEGRATVGGAILSNDVFDCLTDTYGQICRDYGTVFIDEQKSHSILVSAGLNTLAFFHLQGIDVLLSRQATVEQVQWGGDPDKKLESDGTLSPRNSFAAYVKGHLKKGKPWDESDKTIINRLVDQIEKYRSNEIFAEQSEAIQTLEAEKKQAMDENTTSYAFFAHMAHELRTPFHGILGSLEAMREDPLLANNEMLRTAELCGKNMLKILDDILLVAKGSYSLELEEQSVDVLDFLRRTLADMTSYAYMEGVSIRVRKEDVFHRRLHSDFSRIRQVVHNLISNAIKFSENDIAIEVLERGSFRDVLSVWGTYMNSYPSCEPSLKDLAAFSAEETANGSQENTLWLIISVIDKGIGIGAADLKRLGIAFTQLSQGRQKKYQGTGLGINICQMIITALRGKLVIFSAKDYGSCFTFAVPVKMGAKDEADSQAGKMPKSSKSEKKARMAALQAEYESLGIAARNPKLLVVDDSSINRKLCTRKIKTWLPGVAITECSSGKGLIEEYEHDHSIIMGIFLDFHMPGMEGDAAARRIREYEETHEEARRVYIAGYTADVLEDSTQKLLSAGMDSVIPKPEPTDAFECELRNMMRRFASDCGGGSQ